jgi:hypothetical protein
MADFHQHRESLLDARRRRDEADGQLRAARARLAQVRARLAALHREGRATAKDKDGRELLRAEKALTKEIEERAALVERHKLAAAGEIDSLLALDHPQKLASAMSDALPCLLLPVRLETKFMTTPAGARELWVRIFPDDIAVETHEEPLTKDEVDAGTIFWEETWRAGGDAAREEAAWRLLVSKFGATRAAWVARVMEPAGPRPTEPLPEGEPLEPPPVFPEPAPNEAAWSRAPHARVMPDCFVVTAYIGGAKMHEVVGRPIPDPLVLGPDPSAAGQGFDEAATELRVDPALEWLTDFDKAEEVGMAVRLPLTVDEAEHGFDRLLALGLRFSSDPSDAQQRVEQLFDSHHYTDGLAVVRQGTPTNNTEAAGAGHASADTGDAESFRVERGPVLFEPRDDDYLKSDGQRLCDALGLRYETFQHVRDADALDFRDSRAMNRALWRGTLGYFMEEMMRPVFGLDTVGRAREFFTRHVAGRGALPAFRVGRQPYGVLPTTAFSRWKWDAAETDSAFHEELLNVLRRLDSHWAQLVPDVTRAGSLGDRERELLDIMGLHPASVEFHQRMASGPEYLWNLLAFSGINLTPGAWHEAVRGFAAALITDLGYDFAQTPRILNVSFFRAPAQLTGPVVDENPLSETRPIKPFAGSLNYVDWLLRSNSDAIRRQDFGTDADGQPIPPPAALLYLMLRHALTLEYWDTAINIYIREDAAKIENRQESELLNMRGQPETTRWDYLAKPFEKVTGAMRMDEFLQSDAASALAEARELEEVKEALATLARLPTARLERLLAEHLDVCSYRLDAWLLGMVNLRLAAQRRPQQQPLAQKGAPTPVEHVRPTGLHLGAYGWLEELRPAPPRQVVPPDEVPEGFDDPGLPPLTYAPDNGGFIHTPSLNHAAAAAILRSAYLTHADTAEAGRMAVDLSSARVRRALFHLEGVRRGQELGALLGYQFERGLHDRHASLDLDQFILPIRNRYPLVAGRLTPTSAGEAVESLAARNVVNGLALVRAGSYPFGVAGLPPAGSAEAEAIAAEVARLADDLDAVSDLALAEGVFQVAQGNYDRAGAMLKAVSEGTNPPEPQIVETPRGGSALTHRVTINFDADSPATNPWPGVAESPRARVEPQLNHWLGRLLGPPAQVRCRVSFANPAGGAAEFEDVTLADLGLQPLDFVYMLAQDFAAEATEVEARIALAAREARGLAADVPLTLAVFERAAEWGDEVKTFFEILPLASRLRDIVTASRALGADDLLLPSDEVADAGDRRRHDLADLSARVGQAGGAGSGARRALADARALLEAKAAAAAADPVSAVACQELREALLAASLFGLPEAVPATAVEVSTEARDALAAQAAVAAATLAAREGAADALLASAADAAQTTDARAEAFAEAARAVFGPSFKLLPRFTPQNAAELGLAVASSASLLAGAPPLAVDEWLQGLTKVRPKLAAYDAARVLADAFEHESPGLTAVQLPHEANARWLALELAAGQEVAGDRLLLAMHLDAGYGGDSPAQSGLLVDEWIETIPNREETTGLAFHFDRPNSEPPQSLLLAVAPQLTGGWEWEALVDTLHETLELAKKRAVEPDALARTGYSQLLPALMTAVTRHLTTISLDFAMNVSASLYSDAE